jgi:hypothetical protein
MVSFAGLNISLWVLLATLVVIIFLIWLFGDHPGLIVFIAVMHVVMFGVLIGILSHNFLGWPVVHLSG